MERKKKSKTVKQGKPQGADKAVDPDRKSDESEDKPIDYGGMPLRDLKKNLGCG